VTPVFTSDLLIIDDRAVLLKFIESMKFHDGEDLTADVLKDDRHIDIITLSGREYTVSVKKQLSLWQIEKNDIDGYQKAIYEKWLHILRER
jgi:hypothetical protein